MQHISFAFIAIFFLTLWPTAVPAGCLAFHPTSGTLNHLVNASENPKEPWGHMGDCDQEYPASALTHAATTQSASGGALTGDYDTPTDIAQTVFTFRQQAMRPREPLTIFAIAALFYVLLKAAKDRLILRKRKTKRHPANYGTFCRIGDVTTEGQLIDINRYGTRLAAPHTELLQSGDRIKIAIDTEWVDGKVVWSDEDHAGLQFRQAISLRDVNDVIATSRLH